MTDLRDRPITERGAAALTDMSPSALRNRRIREMWPWPMTVGGLERVTGTIFTDEAILRVLDRKGGPRRRQPIRGRKPHPNAAEIAAAIEQAYREGVADGKNGIERTGCIAKVFTRTQVESLLHLALTKQQSRWREWSCSALEQALHPNGPPLLLGSGDSVTNLLSDILVAAELQLEKMEK